MQTNTLKTNQNTQANKYNKDKPKYTILSKISFFYKRYPLNKDFLSEE